jgi:hypothetical protein
MLPAEVSRPEWQGLQTLVEFMATRTVTATGVTTTATAATKLARRH